MSTRHGGAGRACALWLLPGVVSVFLAVPCEGVIRQIHSIKDWRPAFRPFDTMEIFTKMDFQTASVARAEGFTLGGSPNRDFGNADAPISGGAHFAVFQAEPTRFWLKDGLLSPRYGVAVSVFDNNWINDAPAEASLRLYGIGERILGQVSVIVPPANSMAEVTAGARFLAAVSSDPIFSWEFGVGGTRDLGFDDLHITWTAIPVPEPSGLGLTLGAALAAAARIARGRCNSSVRPKVASAALVPRCASWDLSLPTRRRRGSPADVRH